MTSTKIINRVLDRDHRMCVIRGPFCTVHATCADHRAGRGAGGSPILDDPANLIAACQLCNVWKEDATGPDREKLIHRGVRLVKRATNEATLELARIIPLRFPDGTSWRLNSDGTKHQLVAAEAQEILALYGIHGAVA
ncbi:hypothetical protein ABIQ69_11380 [Agromyces sp. G08B096]|uniref:HNH endonuclease n=1 Tax=Agromyces sp. G08B096 TaxID=3156399 RepID=A0AAU7W416_9MICO